MAAIVTEALLRHCIVFSNSSNISNRANFLLRIDLISTAFLANQTSACINYSCFTARLVYINFQLQSNEFHLPLTYQLHVFFLSHLVKNFNTKTWRFIKYLFKIMKVHPFNLQPNMCYVFK